MNCFDVPGVCSTQYPSPPLCRPSRLTAHNFSVLPLGFFSRFVPMHRFKITISIRCWINASEVIPMVSVARRQRVPQRTFQQPFLRLGRGSSDLISLLPTRSSVKVLHVRPCRDRICGKLISGALDLIIARM